MTLFNIGQTIKTNSPTTIESLLTGKTEIIPAGKYAVIGMDRMAHFTNGKVVEFNEPIELTGKYHLYGIAQWIYLRLAARFNIEEMLDEYDESIEDFLDSIVDSLEDLGFENSEEDE